MDKVVEEFVAVLRNAQSGIFATQDNINEAFEYAISMCKEDKAYVTVGLVVFYNTVLRCLEEELLELEQAHRAWPKPEEYPVDGSWPRHETFTVQEWIQDVCDEYTQQSYIDWVNDQIDHEEENEDV